MTEEEKKVSTRVRLPRTTAARLIVVLVDRVAILEAECLTAMRNLDLQRAQCVNLVTRVNSLTGELMAVREHQERAVADLTAANAHIKLLEKGLASRKIVWRKKKG